MIFDSESTYYEVLEVVPDASAQEIKNAYLKVKSAYRKDNVALYSVLDDTETDEMIARIEEAFQILSDPEMKRDYDERHGFYSSIDSKIVSIDRMPPMESGDEMDILIPPTTDFATTGAPAGERSVGMSFLDRRVLPTRRIPENEIREQYLNNQKNTPQDPLTAEIEQETEWRGSFFRRVREIRRISLDDLAHHTKISKTYLTAIEEENYAKLPAPVFIRGFVTQVAKILKLPSDKVALAYMARYKR